MRELEDNGWSKPTPVETKDIFEIDPNTLEVHKIAAINPPMQELEYNAVKIDIDSNGQNEEIKLYRGKIIDGRHRTRICRELGIKVRATNVANNTTIRELEQIALGTDNRRHLTSTQKAIKAFTFLRENKSRGYTQKEVAEKFAVSKSQINNVVKIEREIGIKAVEILFGGEAININGSITSSLNAIVKQIDISNRNKMIEREPLSETDIELNGDVKMIEDWANSKSKRVIIACANALLRKANKLKGE